MLLNGAYALVVSFLLLSCHSVHSQINGCGFGGVDLSPLNAFPDLSVNSDTGGTLFLRICGTVSNVVCLSDTQARTSSLCFVSRVGIVAYRVANNLPADWTWTINYNDKSLTQRTATGEAAGCSFARRTTITYVCDPLASSPIVSIVSEAGEACEVEMIVRTSLPALCQVSPADISCGSDGIDLSPLADAGDINVAYPSMLLDFYIRVCGTVSNFICASDNVARSSSVCIISATGTAYSVTSNNIARSTFKYNSTALIQTSTSGESAGCGMPRSSTIFYMCNPSAINPTATIISAEVLACNVVILIQTALPSICTNHTPPVTSCGNGVIDVSPLSSYGDLTYYDPIFQQSWFVRVCGTVNNAVCAANAEARTSSACVIVSPLPPIRIVANAPNDAIYTYNATSRALTADTANGEPSPCLYPRRATTTYQCNERALVPILTANSLDANNCNNIITIETALPSLCNVIPTEIPLCGAGGIDLSSLNAFGDIFTIIAPFNYSAYISICGTVSFQTCQLDAQARTSSICAIVRNNVAVRVASNNLSDSSVKWITEENSTMITKSETTGETFECGTRPRSSLITFRCNPNAVIPTATAVADPNDPYVCNLNVTIDTALPALCEHLPQISQCGGGLVDLSLLSAFGTFKATTPDGSNVYARVCGAVDTNLCSSNSSTNSSICYISPTQSAYRIVNSNLADSTHTWKLGVMSGTIIESTQSGYICNNNRTRTANIIYRCNENAVIPVMTVQSDILGCIWTILIETALPALCNLRISQPITACGTRGIDLSALNDFGEIGFIDNAITQNTYYFQICGIINTTLCSGLNNITSTGPGMLCGLTNTGQSFSVINSSLTSSTTKFWTIIDPNSADPYALQLVSTDGQALYCSPRAITQFLCDNTAIIPRYQVIQIGLCGYYIIVYTQLVCEANILPSPPVLNATVTVPGCGYGGADLSPLSNAGDLITTTNGITVIMRVCGTVSDSRCLSDSEAMQSSVCSITMGGGIYRVVSSDLRDSSMEWTSIGGFQSSELSLYTANGESAGCTTIQNDTRTATTLFLCDSKTIRPYLIASTTNNCQYQLIVYSQHSCIANIPERPHCGDKALGIDLSEIATYGMLSAQGYYMNGSTMVTITVYYSICDEVSPTFCPDAVGSQMCSVVASPPPLYEDVIIQANINYASPTWRRVIGGFQLHTNNGTATGCLTGRTSEVSFLCRPQSSKPQMAVFTENGCHFDVVVLTAILCTNDASHTAAAIALYDQISRKYNSKQSIIQTINNR